MASVTRNPRPLFVTSLPPAADGLEVYYRADNTNGVIWHLRARSVANGGSATYPWEFVGGGGLHVSVSTDEALAAGTLTYAALTTPVALTIGLIGEYLVSYGARVYSGGAQGLNVAANGCGYTAADADSARTDVTAGDADNASYIAKLTLSSTGTLSQVYKHSSGVAANYANRFMTVTPIRVG